MYKALDCGLIDLSTFDPDEYAFYERVENGDFNWVSKDFIAFASPHDNAFVRALNTGAVDELGSGRGLRKRSKGYQMLLDYFEKNGVGLVVRLNNPLYDKRDFESRGIEFKDMCASPSAAFCLIRRSQSDLFCVCLSVSFRGRDERESLLLVQRSRQGLTLFSRLSPLATAAIKGDGSRVPARRRPDHRVARCRRDPLQGRTGSDGLLDRCACPS